MANSCHTARWRQRCHALALAPGEMGEQTTAAADTEVTTDPPPSKRGVTLIDTAEMYGEGGAEAMIGRALRRAVARDKLYLVSKVYPHNASRSAALLLHASAASSGWVPNTSIAICCTGLANIRSKTPWPPFELLKAQGKIRTWGVSNLTLMTCRRCCRGR